MILCSVVKALNMTRSVLEVKITIVEKCEGVRSALVELLETSLEGVEVRPFATATSAVCSGGLNADLVIVNLGSGDNGNAAILIPVARRQVRHIPIVVVSGYWTGWSEERLEAKARELRADRCLPKPFDFEEVKRVVGQFV